MMWAPGDQVVASTGLQSWRRAWFLVSRSGKMAESFQTETMLVLHPTVSLWLARERLKPDVQIRILRSYCLATVAEQQVV